MKNSITFLSMLELGQELRIGTGNAQSCQCNLAHLHNLQSYLMRAMCRMGASMSGLKS